MARNWVGVAILSVFCGAPLFSQAPEGLFERFLAHMQKEQERLPDYVCSQTIERFNRLSSEQPWRSLDTLRLDVALVGDQELYGRPGAAKFYKHGLAEVIGKGFVSTGRFGLFARQILDITSAAYRYQGQADRDGRPAHEYEFEVTADKSHYLLRSGTVEAPTGYQGAFWIDAPSLDLARLEVQAFDIPEKLGLQEAKTVVAYARVPVDNTPVLLPVSATVTIVTTDGLESLNRMKVSSCRRYQAESTLQMAGDSEAPASPPRSVAPEEPLALAGAVLEVALDDVLQPESAKPGQTFSAHLLRDLKVGERVVAPQGTALRGEVVEIEARSMPFPTYQIGLELNAIEVGGSTLGLSATMETAGPAAGLIRQSKRLEPTFKAHEGAKMNVLVRKVQSGAGFLEWDPRRGPIPRGFKMKWHVLSAEPR